MIHDDKRQINDTESRLLIHESCNLAQILIAFKLFFAIFSLISPLV